MRLDRLVMQALGPFAGREVIDFRELQGQALVLINGQTGAGKTTILDAVCLALYGASSGKSRDGKDMRCDHAQTGLTTTVTLDFRLGDKAYRVHRTPEQMRPKKRGGGEVREKHSVELYDRSQVENDELEGSLIVSGVDKVSKRLGALLRFDEEQFRHVVMLPQGQFRKFLEASSDVRERILESLFSTKQYARIADELKRRRLGLYKQVQSVEDKAKGLLDHAGVGNQEELEARVEVLEAAHVTACAAQPQLAEAHKLARAALDKARADAKALEAVESAKRALTELQSQAKDHERLGSRIEAARRAEALSERNLHAREREAEAKSAKQAAEASAGVADAADAKAKAAEQARIAQEARAPELETLRADHTRLEQLTGAVQAYGGAERELRDSKALATKALSDANAAEASKKAATESIVELEAKVEALGARAAEQEPARVQYEELRDKQTRHQSLLDARRALARAQGSLETRRGELDRSKAAVHDARELHEQRDRAWRHAQAGVLAEGLEEGAPCPVCGSEEHPAPAERRDDAPSDAELEASKTAWDTARTELDKVQSRFGEAEVELARHQSSISTLEAGLGQLAKLDADTMQLRVSDAERAFAVAKHEAKERDEAKRALAAKREAVSELEASYEKLQAAAQRAREAQLEAQSKLDALAGQVPEALRSREALALAIADKAKAMAALSQSIDSAKSAAVEAQRFAAESRSSATAKMQAAATAQEQALSAARALDQGRAEAGLEEDGPWQQALSDLADLPALVEKLRDYEGRVRAAKEHLERTTKEAEGLQAPQLELLSEANDKAEAASNAAIEATTKAKADLDKAKALLEDYKKHVGASAELTAEHQLVSSVAGLAEGVLPPKISFQRYVLAAYLEEVLLSASHRLQEMSEGRYTLHRRQEGGHKAAKAGLELEVMDAYTGKARPVSTLSGGEGFLTSLALSLGLADVATAQSGGIRLDTLFVDEGFGTLDPEALDKAINILTRLNEGGRMVGIISHVPELKVRIGARIDVLKSSEGSRTKVVLP